MSLYEGIKDVAQVLQKADNIDLYRQLLDLCAQALDLQAENSKLRKENEELRIKKSNADRVCRHVEPVITLTDDTENLYYCSHCWDSEQLLIQVSCLHNGVFVCPHCKTSASYDNDLKQESDEKQLAAISSMGRSSRKFL